MSNINPDRINPKYKTDLKVSYTSSDAQSFIENDTTSLKYDIIALHTLTNDIKSKSSLDCVNDYGDLIAAVKSKNPESKIVASLETNRTDDPKLIFESGFS